MRNCLLKTKNDPTTFPFGKYFIQQKHLEDLLKIIDKDKHVLTATCLNPTDRQNVDSARRICDRKVINLLQKNVYGSDGTVIYLEIMSDMYAAFEDKNLSPLERVSKMWRSVFLVRIWRDFILKKPGLTLKYNFVSSFCYHCIEINAHSLVFMLLYLKKHQLTHLFFPHKYSSQPCESFYRQLRSLSSVNSTVVNFSMKEILHRISRIQLLNDISNDKDSGFSYPKQISSDHFTEATNHEFPTEHQIIETIQKCKTEAIREAVKVGLLKKNSKTKESSCVCPVLPYTEFRKKKMNVFDNTIFEKTFEELDAIQWKLISASIKNYTHKFKENSLPDTSLYVEVYANEQRYVFKKTSLCFMLSKESYKCSSDRMYRVRNTQKTQARKICRVKTLKTHCIKKNTTPKTNIELNYGYIFIKNK